MLIDRKRPEFSDVPESLEGEVLLERIYGPDGEVAGFVTASLEAVRSMKTKSAEELSAEGWARYRDILDTTE